MLSERQLRRQQRARADWNPPGPIPPGDQGDPDLFPAEDETLDAFAGHWRLFQLRGGHRYSTDDLLCAWYAFETMQRLGRLPARVLDLGTGLGSVGLWLAWLWSDMELTGLEVQPRSLDLARRSARYNGVSSRVRYLEGDLREAGGPPGPFDLITGSPPYWKPLDGTLSEAPQKGPCRFELRGGLESYCLAARTALGPGGRFILVFDGRQRLRLERAAAEAGWSIARLREVVPREGKPVLLILAALGHPADVLETHEEPPLVLRDAAGARLEEFRLLRARMGLPTGR